MKVIIIPVRLEIGFHMQDTPVRSGIQAPGSVTQHIVESGLAVCGKVPDMNGRAWLGIGEAIGRMAFNFAGCPFYGH